MDRDRYGFILADAMIGVLFYCRILLSGLLVGYHHWNKKMVDAVYEVTNKTNTYLLIQVQEIKSIFNLARNILRIQSKVIIDDRATELRNKVKCWVDSTTNLQEQLKEALLGMETDPCQEKLHIGTVADVDGSSGVSVPISSLSSRKNDMEGYATIYSPCFRFLCGDEIPKPHVHSWTKYRYWYPGDLVKETTMPYFMTEMALKNKRKETLLYLCDAYEGRYRFIPDLYTKEILEALRSVFIDLMRFKSYWDEDFFRLITVYIEDARACFMIENETSVENLSEILQLANISLDDRSHMHELQTKMNSWIHKVRKLYVRDEET
ncbi:hypothetical protein AQUCO_00901009v1 [Aquilegia coerulea]|nr:hypothetical protein AQUCO_00901009v1 [Aquilegia coerulea]